ncbi:MAG: ATP-binding protein, partial [Chloroflexota bacterium]
AAAAPARAPLPGDLADAAAIVTLLDGLPLAIELAAAQGVTLPTSAIAGLLRNAGLAALARGRRDGPARFQTMEAAIAWSADLLPLAARRLFTLLGLFRGGFTIEALTQTTALLGEPGLIAALPALAESQLVEHDPGDPDRMRMLEPVRMFARDRLHAAAEEPAVRRAHAAWFLGWAQEQAAVVAGAHPLPALNALDADLANLQVAFETAANPEFGLLDAALLTAAQLGQYWEFRLRTRESRTVLERAIAAALAERARDPGAVALVPLLEAIHYSAYFAYVDVDVPAVERDAERMAPLVEEDGSLEYRARLELIRIFARDARGEPAADLLDAIAAAHALVADEPRGEAWEQTNQGLANLKMDCGDFEGALPLLQAYLDWARQQNGLLHQGQAATWIGYLQLQLGQREQALASFRIALEGPASAPWLGTLHWTLLGMAAACSWPDQDANILHMAARLLGAFAAFEQRMGFGLTAMQAQIRADSRERLAAALGEARLESLIAEGRDLPRSAVLAVAQACGAAATAASR